MHPEMEPNYSKQRLIFRPKTLLLGWWGGMHPPHPPPLNPPLNTSYKHLAKKFERAVLKCVGRDGSEMAVRVRLDWTRSNAKRRLATFASGRLRHSRLRESSRVVANLRDWSLHRLILTTYF